MFTKTNLSSEEKLKLRSSHVKVSGDVFILLASKDEVKKRKALVKEYGRYSNITFYSDGSVFMDGRLSGGATGWIVPTMPSR